MSSTPPSLCAPWPVFPFWGPGRDTDLTPIEIWTPRPVCLSWPHCSWGRAETELILLAKTSALPRGSEEAPPSAHHAFPLGVGVSWG